MDFPELVTLFVGIGTFISLVAGGVWWLVKIAISKGTEQAETLSSKLEYIGQNINDRIQANDEASRERHGAISKRLEEHNSAMKTQIQDLKDQNIRQLEFTKTVDGKVMKVQEDVSKVSSRVSKLEGRIAVGG